MDITSLVPTARLGARYKHVHFREEELQAESTQVT